MLIDGMCIPCTMTSGRGVLLVNDSGFNVIVGFKEYIQSCGWWNKYVAGDESSYDELVGYTLGSDSRLYAVETTSDIKVLGDNHKTEMFVINKRTGRMTGSQFDDFTNTWNEMLGVDASEPSLVVGSVFNEELEAIYE